MGMDFDIEGTIGKAIPDGVFKRDGETYAVEIDNAGKQSRKQYQDKWKHYGKFGGFILVICHTEARMKSVLSWSEAVKDLILGTTFTRLAAGEPWTDWAGKTVEL